LPPPVDRAAYRILQEALTNAARHGDGAATVEIKYEQASLELIVENAIEARPAAESGGLGLVGMSERATLLGGTLDARAGGGQFRVHARLPNSEVAE
jgi:signal transduction histidine kinase